MERGLIPSFGSLVRQHRRAARLTQEELADRSGVSARAIGDIERGVSQAPQRDTVRLLEDALELVGDARTTFDAAARQQAVRVSTRTALAPGLAPPLVGRAPELDLLDRHLSGRGAPLVLLAGEPGMGKTRLLGEAARLASSRGWCVLEGGCQRRSGQEAFAPLVGALAAFLSRRAAVDLRADLRACAWLVRLLPELADAIGEALPSWTVPADQERRLMFQAVGRLLDNVAAREAPEAGAVLVLDDLQWAGSDAIELLTMLIRPDRVTAGSTGQRALRVIGAYRNNEVRPEDVLGVAVADWAQAGLVAHHALPPLSPRHCGELFDALLSAAEDAAGTDDGEAARRQAMVQRAGGVPFFVVSYAHALRESGGGAQAVPWDIAQGIRQRVAALPEAAHLLLAAAAVVGRELDPSVVAEVAEAEEDYVLAGLEALCQARLLIDTGRAYQFAHDLVREVIEADVGSARRAVLHRRTATAIETRCAANLTEHFEALADHWLRGEVWERALEYLIRSGDKAARAGAIREALIHYEQALAVCARLGEAALDSTVEVANKRGFICYDAGEFAAATADFARMRAAAGQLGDPRRESLALAQVGMAAFYDHDFEAAERALRDALATGQAFEDVRLFATVQLNSLFMVMGRYSEAAPLFVLAEGLAPRVDDPLSQSWWGICGSEVLHWSGRYADALAHLARWQSAVEASNQLVTLLWTKWETALACGGAGEFARALTLLDDVIATCRATGESFVQARALNTAGWIHGELYNHARALDLNAQSLALAEEIETADTEITSNARLNLGDSLLALGRLDEADEHYRAVERVVRSPRPQDRWMLWRYAQHLFHSVGELRLARGEVAAALAYADECLNAAAATESLKNVVKARRLRGQALLARGDLAAAEVELGSALEAARRLGNPPQLWKTLVATGDHRVAARRTVDAGSAYGEAMALIERIGAGLPNADTRQAFLSSAQVQRIIDQAAGRLSTAPSTSIP